MYVYVRGNAYLLVRVGNETEISGCEIQIEMVEKFIRTRTCI